MHAGRLARLGRRLRCDVRQPRRSRAASAGLVPRPVTLQLSAVDRDALRRQQEVDRARDRRRREQEAERETALKEVLDWQYPFTAPARWT